MAWLKSGLLCDLQRRIGGCNLTSLEMRSKWWPDGICLWICDPTEKAGKSIYTHCVCFVGRNKWVIINSLRCLGHGMLHLKDSKFRLFSKITLIAVIYSSCKQEFQFLLKCTLKPCLSPAMSPLFTWQKTPQHIHLCNSNTIFLHYAIISRLYGLRQF